MRLWLNKTGYAGERVDIAGVLRDCEALAQGQGWTVGWLSGAGESLMTLARAGRGEGGEPPRVYISAGIHGDEPAGPLAVRRLLELEAFPREINLWLCPCLNPAGFRINRRENAGGLDLNRQYLQLLAEETAAHVKWLEALPNFDLAVCLHEDWESHGFYVYELNPDGRRSVAEQIVARVGRVCPIDTSETIEGRPAAGGIIRPDSSVLLRPDWPEAFYLLTHKTRLSCTLEAPSDFRLEVRTEALVEGVRASLEALGQQFKS